MREEVFRIRMFAKVKLVIVFLSSLIVAYGLVGGMINKVSAGEDAYKGLSVFTDVLNKVREDYVEQPDMEKAMQGALQGMMGALDPYASFVNAETYQRIKESQNNVTGWPGVFLSKRYNYAHVVAVMPGSSADREGVYPGDLFESIDDEVTTEMSLWEAENLLLGPSGSTVNVRLVRARRGDPTEMKLLREDFPSLEVTVRMAEEEIGLLRIPQFREGVAERVRSKLRILQSSGIQGLLVDLRGTARGLVEEAVKLSDLFLPKRKKILTIEDRGGKKTEFWSLARPAVVGVPIVFLIDGGTSGPAEVFAAALQDHEIVKTVGEKTNGRGATQEQFSLRGGAVLFISTKLYYRPAGRPIQSQNLRSAGVTPDVLSPREDFVANFYFERAMDGLERNPRRELYRELKEAVKAEQLKSGLRQIRAVLREAA